MSVIGGDYECECRTASGCGCDLPSVSVNVWSDYDSVAFGISSCNYSVASTPTHKCSLSSMTMTKMELESTLVPRKPFTSLEELRKRMLTNHEWWPTLSSHRIHGIFSVFETMFEVRIGKDFIGFVESSHFWLLNLLCWGVQIWRLLRLRKKDGELVGTGYMRKEAVCVLGFFDRFRVCVSRKAYNVAIILLFTLFQYFLRFL